MVALERKSTIQPNDISDDRRFAAVLARDCSFDGRFVYGVVTTGVYCRPSCAARKPLRENARFFSNGQAALLAGYRACKRCMPDEANKRGAHLDAVEKACRMIESAGEAPRLEEMAALCGLSVSHFHRIFKAVTGVTPKTYELAWRREKVRHSLASCETVTDAIYAAGFGSSGRFYSGATKLLGMPVSSFRRGGEAVQLKFAVGECSLGSILVAVSIKGIAAISLGDDPGELVRDLQNTFSRAELSGGEAEFDLIIAKIIGFVENPQPSIDLPLDIVGTLFQQRVWKVLSEIPVGSTVSYSDVAECIGMANGARAVAKACGANKHAVVIPCHRVVRLDGSISGYRWGIERKKRLLAGEKQVVNKAFSRN